MTLQKPIEQAIHHYGAEVPEFLRLLMVALKMRKVNEELVDCFVSARESRLYQAIFPAIT